MEVSILSSCAVRTDGAAICSGYDGDGRASPPNGTATAIATGSSSACELRADGTVSCWSSDADGRASPPAGAFVALAAGAAHTRGTGIGSFAESKTRGMAPLDRGFDREPRDGGQAIVLAAVAHSSDTMPARRAER